MPTNVETLTEKIHGSADIKISCVVADGNQECCFLSCRSSTFGLEFDNSKALEFEHLWC